jgi:hypothetical protein
MLNFLLPLLLVNHDFFEIIPGKVFQLPITLVTLLIKLVDLGTLPAAPAYQDRFRLHLKENHLLFLFFRLFLRPRKLFFLISQL